MSFNVEWPSAVSSVMNISPVFQFNGNVAHSGVSHGHMDTLQQDPADVTHVV